MQIEIIKVDTENKGKYQCATVAYKSADGKIEGKKVMSFGPSKDVFKVVAQSQPGDCFDVKSEKVGDFWNWTGIVSSGKSLPETVGSTTTRAASVTPRSTYETPEERAKKQVYIVRQSSISNAIALLTHNTPKGVVDENAVVEVAERFTDFVFNGNDESASYLALPEAPTVE